MYYKAMLIDMDGSLRSLCSDIKRETVWGLGERLTSEGVHCLCFGSMCVGRRA